MRYNVHRVQKKKKCQVKLFAHYNNLMYTRRDLKLFSDEFKKKKRNSKGEERNKSLSEKA